MAGAFWVFFRRFKAHSSGHMSRLFRLHVLVVSKRR